MRSIVLRDEQSALRKAVQQSKPRSAFYLCKYLDSKVIILSSIFRDRIEVEDRNIISLRRSEFDIPIVPIPL